jgi:hypothetical protein
MSRYTSFGSLINDYRNSFTNSDKLELGIFWLSDDLTEVIHFRTVLEEDTDNEDPAQYSFMHYHEWDSRPQGIPGEYTDYPRGRIFYQDNQYVVEINHSMDVSVKKLICEHFLLPVDTLFKSGYW